MSSYQELHALLLSAKNACKSGKIYLYGKDKNALRSGIIILHQGEVSDILFLQHPPKTVLSELFALSIHKILFNPQDNLAPQNRHPELPDTDAILALLEILIQQHHEAVNSQLAISVSETLDLKLEAQRLLEKIYGAGIAKKVDAIAALYSPIDNPLEFLNQCKQLAVVMLGGVKAAQLFQELYDQIS